MVAVLVFLGVSDFFTAWHGKVVSSAPAHSDDARVLTVRIVGPDRAVIQRDWPADLVRQLEVPVDRVDVPPPTIPDDRPDTHKDRFTLSYRLTMGEGAEAHDVTLPTTSPRGLGIAALVFGVLLAGRNMVYAGSPIAIRRQGVYLPPAQDPAGVPVRGNDGGKGRGKARGRKGPPPSKRRRGRGRR